MPLLETDKFPPGNDARFSPLVPMNDLCRAPFAPLLEPIQIAGSVLQTAREPALDTTAQNEVTMTKFAHQFDQQTNVSVVPAGPVVLQTEWGYSLGEQASSQPCNMLLRKLGKFLGVAFALFILGFWVLQSASPANDPVLLIMKLGVSGLFVGIGWLLYNYGSSAAPVESHVDLERKEVRRGILARNGQFELDICIDFAEITSIVIAAETADADEVALFARLDDSSDAIEIISGTEEQLVPIRDRLVRDLKNNRGSRANREIAERKGFALPSLSPRMVPAFA